ncbi:MAG: hypothetical protein EON47_21890 [Acetobacteraceae bacterium]|nr:MAG: hypothetical protein EON47_21890 [Acetobacteraceae bacterium]
MGDATQMGRGEVTLPYVFAAQAGYAQHFAQDMHRLCEALTAAFGRDVQVNDVRRPASMQILDSVFDVAGMLDLGALRAPRSEEPAAADAVTPPPVVAAVDRGKRAPAAPRAAAGTRPRRPTSSKSAVAADGTLLPPPTLLPTTFEMSPTRPRFA